MEDTQSHIDSHISDDSLENIENNYYATPEKFDTNPYDDNKSKSSSQDTNETSPTCDDISPTIDLECYTSFEQCCESILEMSPVINTNDLTFPERQLSW